MTDKNKEPGDKNKDDRSQRKGLVSALIMSQFAYTLVIVTLLFGYCGHWLGKTFLGGEPMSTVLMLVLGTLGFGLEIYRMVKMIKSDNRKDQSD